MKLNKPYTNAQYADLAVYCNKNGKVIEDKGDYLEAVAPSGPSDEELQQRIRLVRNQYLNDTDKFMLADFPIADAELENYKAYRQYLRDYTQTDEWWWAEPAKIEEWLANNEVEKTDELQK